MDTLKVVMVSPEVSPFAKTGGLADVAGSLPLELESLGCQAKVFLPYYRQVKNGDFGIKLLREDMMVILGERPIDFRLFVCRRKNVDFYFIGKDEYFDRDYLYGTPSGDYPDNAVRFAFFAKAVLGALKVLNFKPDLIHCNDWQSALIPFYLRFSRPPLDFFKNTKTLFTVHNIAYQGLFENQIIRQLDIGYEFFTPDALEFYGKLNFMKSGVLYSDAVSTVSKGYARQILTQEYGCGLEGLFGVRENDLYGIMNGADYSEWSPKTDKYIKVNYDKKSLANKMVCKKDLLSHMRLKTSSETPLLGIVSRLAEQKGIDIIAAAVQRIIKLGCGLVILGTGDEKYHKLLTEFSNRYPGHIAVKIAFDNPLAHKIEAGCDMFLMPSRYEPCGLNQMYSLKYGTIPVVRATGGLDDTIVDYTENPKQGNGFKFDLANAEDFIDAVKRALKVYKNNKEWQRLIFRAMDYDFSWRQSAKEYLRLYNRIRSKS